MRIRLEHDGTAFEFERNPMSERRFRAMCSIAAAGLYVGLTIGVTALCGVPGLLVLSVVTLIFSLLRSFDMT